MLEIQAFAVETIRALNPVVREIAGHDSDLGRQIRRSASSIVLNIAEAQTSRDGTSRQRLKTALGSTRETAAALEVAEAWGYVGRDERLRDAFDRIAATLYRLTR